MKSVTRRPENFHPRPHNGIWEGLEHLCRNTGSTKSLQGRRFWGCITTDGQKRKSENWISTILLSTLLLQEYLTSRGHAGRHDAPVLQSLIHDYPERTFLRLSRSCGYRWDENYDDTIRKLIQYVPQRQKGRRQDGNKEDPIPVVLKTDGQTLDKSKQCTYCPRWCKEFVFLYNCWISLFLFVAISSYWTRISRSHTFHIYDVVLRLIDVGRLISMTLLLLIVIGNHYGSSCTNLGRIQPAIKEPDFVALWIVWFWVHGAFYSLYRIVFFLSVFSLYFTLVFPVSLDACLVPVRNCQTS